MAARAIRRDLTVRGKAKSTRRGGPGISVRHARHCASQRGGDCSCRPSYQAQAWSARDDKPIRKTFRTLPEAKRWRQEASVGRGPRCPPASPT